MTPTSAGAAVPPGTGDAERTGWLTRRLVAYRPMLMVANLLLWGIFHAMPALTFWLISRVMAHLQQADALRAAGAGDGAGTSAAITAAWLAVAAFAVLRPLRAGVFMTAFIAWIKLWRVLETLLRRNLLAWLLTAPGARRMPDTPAEAVSRFRDDVEDVSAYVEVWVDGAGMVVFCIVAVVLMLRVDPVITAVVCTPLLAVLWGVKRCSPVLRLWRRRLREATARVTDFVGETFAAVASVKLAGREDGMTAQLARLGETRRHAAQVDVLLTEAIRGVNAGMVGLAVGTMLLLGAAKVRGGGMAVADFVLFIGLLPRLTGAMAFLGEALARHRRTGVSWERMLRLLQDAPPAAMVQAQPLALDDAADGGDAAAPPPQPARPASDRLQRLEVRGLTALHGDTGRGVRDIHFGIRRGEFIVITGRVGSGKTTLLRALLGLMPVQQGQIVWNGAVVADPASFMPPPHAAYTPQLPHLVSDSLGHNVVAGGEPALVAQALQRAVLGPDLAALPAGLQTQVGARGVKLSGGQIQRTAVARMLAREADLLVFDDVSSALDAHTEAQLWAGLVGRRGGGDTGVDGGATCLVVSHRRAALARADRILLLADGRLVDQGPLAELLQRSALMRGLWDEEEGPAG